MTADPTATPVTDPLGPTLAMVGASELHTTARPTNSLPLASLAVTVKSDEVPMTSSSELGVTWTDETGTGDTVIVEEPVLPSTSAVITAEPGESAVT